MSDEIKIVDPKLHLPGKPVKEHWIVEAWTVDGRFRYFIIATRADAELFRLELEQMEGEYAIKKRAPFYLACDLKIPWREVESEMPSTQKFKRMEDKLRQHGPILSD